MTVGLVVVGIIIFSSLTAFVIFNLHKKSKQETTEKKQRAKYKCAVGACEVFINTKKTDDKFCEFHARVQKAHFILVEKQSKMQHKTLMYMSTNALLFASESSKEKIYKELESLIKK